MSSGKTTTFSLVATFLLNLALQAAGPAVKPGDRAGSLNVDPAQNRRAVRFSSGLKEMDRNHPARPSATNLPSIDETEKAVVRALNWLTGEQQEEGYWQKTHSKVAHTGLAALCYLSFGVMPEDNTPYGRALDKGTEWMIKQVNKYGDMRDGDKMYGQAIGALTMAEMYIITKDEKYRKPLQAAINFISKAQNPKSGGWRHQPWPSSSQRGDLSVTGWIYMALQSAKKAGIDVSKETIDKADKFISSVSAGEAKGLYGYLRSLPTASMTSVGMFCRQLAGSDGNEKRQAESAEYLSTHLPQPDQQLRGTGHYHYWYYGTHAMYLHGGDEWAAWHEELVPILLVKQETDGSWSPQGQRAKHEGRVVTTAWATLSLTVYYKCLPMLQGTQTKSPRKFGTKKKKPKKTSVTGRFLRQTPRGR